MKIILQLFDHAQGVFAIEDNKPDCIEKLTELVKDEPRLSVCALQTKYPQGGERQLIYAVTQRAINSSMLPADESCIVDNVETIIAVYNAVKFGKPVTSRVATITGDAIANPGNFLYSIGTSYTELVEAAGGFKEQPQKIISGGSDDGICDVWSGYPDDQDGVFPALSDKGRGFRDGAERVHQLRTLRGDLSGTFGSGTAVKVCGSWSKRHI